MFKAALVMMDDHHLQRVEEKKPKATAPMAARSARFGAVAHHLRKKLEADRPDQDPGGKSHDQG